MKMNKVRMAIAGIGGYGDYCLGLMERFADPESYELVGAIDPFYDRARRADKLRAAGVPLYRELDEFYAADSCELLLIASPIHLHKQQCLTAFAHGSNVLCEKPLAPILQDAREIDAAARKAGVKLGVGFQMSFCKPIQELKRDILSGLLGKPLKCCKPTFRGSASTATTTAPWKRPPARPDTASWVSIPLSPTPPRTICTTPASSSVRTWAVPRLPVSEHLTVRAVQRQGHRNVRHRVPARLVRLGRRLLTIAVTHSGDQNIDPILRYDVRKRRCNRFGQRRTGGNRRHLCATVRQELWCGAGRVPRRQKTPLMIAVTAAPLKSRAPARTTPFYLI